MAESRAIRRRGYGYNSALSLVSTTMPNAATTSRNFDLSTGLLDSSTSVHGATTNYSYTFNHWKIYTNNALGQLVQVTEPNPVYPASNYVTSYTYDIEGHLTQVYMQRPTSGAGMQTQTRAFHYDLPTGHLLSATNPENGTVSFTYYPDGLLASKTDAKGQKVAYSYDGYGRISYIDRYPAGSQTADICQSLTLSYDNSTNAALGRVYSVSWGPPFTTPMSGSCSWTSMTEAYSYNAAGQVTSKSYGATFEYCNACSPVYYGWYMLGEGYTYDNEGTLTSYADDYYQNNQLPIYLTTYTYTLDAMERPVSLLEQDSVNSTGQGYTQTGSKTWVQNATYGPSGEMTGIQCVFRGM